MIRIGRVVDVIGDADNGKFGAKIVKLAINDLEHEVTAFAKELSDLEFLVELVTALLGRELGIPIPEPIIAYSKDARSVLFASIDAKHPDLTKRLSISDNKIDNTKQNNAILKQLSEWSHINTAISFDEWIANDDRNVGNVLYDGSEIFLLIDHNRAMRLPFSPDAPINNVLLNIHMLFNQDEVSKQRVKNSILHIIDGFNTALPKEIAYKLKQQANGLDEVILDDMIEFLRARLTHLGRITTGKIPVKQQSL